MKKQMMLLAAALVMTVGNFAHAAAETGDWKNDPAMSEVAKNRIAMSGDKCPRSLASGDRTEMPEKQPAAEVPTKNGRRVQ